MHPSAMNIKHKKIFEKEVGGEILRGNMLLPEQMEMAEKERSVGNSWENTPLPQTI